MTRAPKKRAAQCRSSRKPWDAIEQPVMEVGYAVDTIRKSAKAQEQEIADYRPRARVYIPGRGAETFDAIVAAFKARPDDREKRFLIADSLAVFGNSQDEVAKACGRIKDAGCIIFDIAHHERSDRDGIAMQRRGAKDLHYAAAMGFSTEIARARGRRGGVAKRKASEQRRLDAISNDVLRRLLTHPKLNWDDRADILGKGFSVATCRRLLAQFKHRK